VQLVYLRPLCRGTRSKRKRVQVVASNLRVMDALILLVVGVGSLLYDFIGMDKRHSTGAVTFRRFDETSVAYRTLNDACRAREVSADHPPRAPEQ
jgi:hypothetical protein